MIKSLNTAATGMQAQQTNMDTIANNIANVSTTGFKRQRAEFEDLLYQTIKDPGASTGYNSISPTGVQVGLGVKTNAIHKDFTQGHTNITNNPFDLEIEGQGFFMIELPDGKTGYTRDGSFKKSSDGRIVTNNGFPIVPQITIPSDASQIEINGQGQVFVMSGNASAPANIGQIQVANFVNPAGLKSVGKNLFIPTPSSGEAQVSNPGDQGMGALAQGQLETSNVNIVNEMVEMIRAQRAYETNSKVIQASDQMLQTINTIR